MRLWLYDKEEIYYKEQDILCVDTLNNVLLKLQITDEIYLFVGPGEYTKTRINISIGKALQLLGYGVFGVNVLHFSQLFYRKNIYLSQGYYFINHADTMEMRLNVDLDDYVDYGQNIDPEKANYIHLNAENFLSHAHLLNTFTLIPMYFDKFTKTH